MNKTLITSIIVAVIFATGGFYGGTVYEKNSLSSQGLLRSGNNRGNFVSGQNGQSGQGQNRGQGGMMRQGGANSGFTTGQIISKDDKSITVKTRDGGSKIVYFSDSTSVGKSVDGNSSDLATGQQVMIGGQTNSDGSLTAQNIQIRPDQPNQSVQPQN